MEHNEWIGKFTGIVSMLLFIVANAYYPVRLVANKYRPWPFVIAAFFNKYFNIHMWLNVGAFVFMSISTYYTDNRNTFLYVSMLVTALLTLTGFLKYLKRFSSDTKKQLRLLYSQQTILACWLVLLLCGKL